MPKITVAGHPLHPQVIVLPAGLLPFSFALDLMHRITGKPSYVDAAYYSMLGGYAGGIVAAVAGLGDYLDIPSGSKTKQAANVHLTLNLGIMGLYSANLLLRRGRGAPGALPLALSAIGSVGLLISAWYGGHMVYEYGMRVKQASPEEDKGEARLPGDEQVTGALEAAQSMAPAGQPLAQEEPRRPGFHAA
jgi:uncharacterized membrane protein